MLGRCPDKRLGGVDEAGTCTAFEVEVVGQGAGVGDFGVGWSVVLKAFDKTFLTTAILCILRFISLNLSLSVIQARLCVLLQTTTNRNLHIKEPLWIKFFS